MSTEQESVLIDMVIDTVSDHMFWLEIAEGRIQRSDLNGRNITTVLSLGLISTFDIDIKNRFVPISY